MISRISGKLLEKQPTYVVIDVHGIGYEVFISTQTFYTLDELNKNITLFIQSIVRDDTYSLFGFINSQEKDVFRLLIKINGIGAKAALNILSVVSHYELIEIIINENAKLLSTIPGIGKKTAERLILELKDKLVKNNFLRPNSGLDTNQENDIINALMSLGYTQKETLQAIRNIPKNIDISQAIKLALNNIVKK